MHFFEPDRATHLIPECERYIDRLRELQSKIHEKQADIDSRLIVGGITEPTKYTLAQPRVKKGVKEMNELIEIFNRVFIDMNDRGFQLKGIEEGLIDFYHIRGNDIVNLCWKYGEKKIEFWHSIHQGFSQRLKI